MSIHDPGGSEAPLPIIGDEVQPIGGGEIPAKLKDRLWPFIWTIAEAAARKRRLPSAHDSEDAAGQACDRIFEDPPSKAGSVIREIVAHEAALQGGDPDQTIAALNDREDFRQAIESMARGTVKAICDHERHTKRVKTEEGSKKVRLPFNTSFSEEHARAHWTDSDPADAAIRKEQIRRLEEALNELDDETRQIFVLRNDHSISEIARQSGLSRKTVDRLYKAGVAELARRLRDF